MKFYQENKINPLGGCLPLLLQMPVFFVLYRVLHQLTRTCTAGLLASGACTTIGNFAPSYLDHSTQLWQDLTATDQMLAFGMDLSQSAANQMRDSFVGALPYLVLILAVTATSYIQQLQISARNKSGTPINPQQAMLLKILPAFFAFISLTLPAGIVVYFLVSNLYRIAQQAYITRAFYRHDAEKEAELEAKGKPEPKTASAEPKAPVLPPAAKKAQAQAAKSGKPAPKPAPKGTARSTLDSAAQAQVVGDDALVRRRVRPRAMIGGTSRVRRVVPVAHTTAQEEEALTAVQWVETTGRTVEEALDAALDRLGVGEEDAEVEILEEPRPGLFGRMRGEARLRVRVRPTTPRPKAERRDRRRRPPRDGERQSTNGPMSASRRVQRRTACIEGARRRVQRRSPSRPRRLRPSVRPRRYRPCLTLPSSNESKRWHRGS